MTKPEEVVEISDPEINVEEIMDCIRQRLQARQAQAEARGQDYARLVDGAELAGQAGAAAELQGPLHQLRQSADGLRLSPAVTDWRLPIINGPVNRAKNALHNLVLMYVNMLAARQIAVNRLISQTLMNLASAQQADHGRIEALEKEVAALREQLARQEPGAGGH